MRHLFILLMLCLYSFGCGWVNGTTINGHWEERRGGHPLYAEDMGPDGLLYSMQSRSDAVSAYLSQKFSDQDREDNVTQAVLKMLKGEPHKAIELLLIEEKKGPGRYEVAANLGTAYELSGDVVNALQWIKAGMDRNASSHHGTEWLHLKILETKLRLKDDKNYLNDHHVLDEEEYAYGRMDITRALLYQLKERMLFIKPKDPIVADLLYTYAISFAHNGGFLEYSTEALNLAEQYGYSNSQELINKRQEYQDIIDHLALMQDLKLAAFVFGFFLFLFIAYKKKWFFLSKKEQDKYIAQAKESQIEKSEKTGSPQEIKSSQVVVGRVLIVIAGILALYVMTTSNDLMATFFTLVTGLVFAYYFISNGRAYEKKVNETEEDHK